MSFIVCGVFDGATARISAISNLDEAFRKWNSRYGLFLPTVAFQCDPALFRRVTNILRLPHTSTTTSAAGLLCKAPVDLSAQSAVFKQIGRLGPKAEPLFREWRLAVSAARGSTAWQK